MLQSWMIIKKNVFEFTLKKFKRVDVLVNNAGIMLEQDPLKTLGVNVMGPINGCQTAFQYMGKSKGGKGGIVVNTASIAGFIVHPGFPAYCASKHAVIALTRSYGHSFHFEKEGIIFSALCPSCIETDLLYELAGNSLIVGLEYGSKEKNLKPDGVAQGVIKLLEDRINGSTLVVTKDEGFFYVGIQEIFKEITVE